MDIQLHFLEAGAGFPLVLLHGNGSSSAYFEAQIDYFSKFCHVYALDTRGHGQSPRGTAPFTMHQFAEDLRVFLDAHNLKRVHLLGFSDGGNIALTFALLYPQYIEKLIVNGANLNTKGVKRHLQIPIEWGYKIAKRQAHKSDAAKRKCEIMGLMVNEPNINPQQLKNLSMPTLVLVGSNDMIKASHSEKIAAALPNAHLVTLKGGHCISKDAPKLYNQTVEDFLKGNL